MNSPLRNFAAGLALAATAITTPGCSKQHSSKQHNRENAESELCISAENLIRFQCREMIFADRIKKERGGMGLDDLCIEETEEAQKMESFFIEYMDYCDVPKAKEDVLKSKIKAIKELQLKTCSDANPIK